MGIRRFCPLEVDPNIFTSPSISENERYEGMLLELRNPNGPLSVVNSNPDEPSNFGEWRVGSDTTNTSEGCLILTGRQTSSITSSLNVSYVNDEAWETNSGTMNVIIALIVQNGDKFDGIRGVLTYEFGNFKLLPRNNDDVLLKTVGLKDLAQDERVMTVSPNPTSTHAQLDFELPRQENIEIVLTDINGHYIKQLQSATNMESGVHSIPLNFNLQPGTYLVTMRTNSRFETIRVVRY